MRTEYYSKFFSDKSLYPLDYQLLCNSVQFKESAFSIQKLHQSRSSQSSSKNSSTVSIVMIEHNLKFEIEKSPLERVSRNKSSPLFLESSKKRGSKKKQALSENSENIKHVILAILTNKKFLFEKIISTRKASVEMIIKNLRKYVLVTRARKHIFIMKILEARVHNAKKIQMKFRLYLVYKHFKSLREYDIIFFYSFNESSMGKMCLSLEKKVNHKENLELKSLKMKVKDNGFPNQALGFLYSKYLKTYYLPFKKPGIMKKKFKVNFIVNGHAIIDPRYEVDTDEDGQFYNVIDSHMLYRKFKFYSPKLRKKVFFNHKDVCEKKDGDSKFWENIFQIKSRRGVLCEYSSSSDITDKSTGRMRESGSLNAGSLKQKESERNLKSILKNKNCENCKMESAKKVTFSQTVEYSY